MTGLYTTSSDLYLTNRKLDDKIRKIDLRSFFIF